MADYFARRVAKHPFGARIPTDDFAIKILANNSIISRFNDGHQQRMDFLGPFAFRDIHYHTGHADRLARYIIKRLAAHTEKMEGIIGPGNPEFDGELGFLLEGSGDVRTNGETILRMNQVKEMLVRAAEDAALQPKKFLRVLIPGDAIRFNIPIPNSRPGCFQGQAQPFFTFTQSNGLLLDASEHLVKGIGEKTQFIATGLGGADRIIAPLGNYPGGIGEVEDGSRDAALQGIRNTVSDQSRRN